MSDNLDVNIFAQRFKEMREQKRMNINQLSIEINIANQTLYQWERGRSKPGMDGIIAIAKFFNVSADYLLGLREYE